MNTLPSIHHRRFHIQMRDLRCSQGAYSATFRGHWWKSEANLLCLTPPLQLPLLGRVERSRWQQNEHVVVRWQYLGSVTKTFREWQGRDTHAEKYPEAVHGLSYLITGLKTSWGKMYHKKSFYNNIESKWAFENVWKFIWECHTSSLHLCCCCARIILLNSCFYHDSLPLRGTSTRNTHLSVNFRLWEITASSSFSDQILHYMGSGEGL